MVEIKSSEVSQTPRLKIAPHKFLPEMIGEVRENIGKIYLFTLNVAGALGLGGLFLGLTGEKLYPGMTIATSGIVTLIGGIGLARTAAEVYRQNAFEKIFPTALENGSISPEALKIIVADKANAVVPEQSADPLKFKPQSLIPYKKRLILEFAKSAKTEESAGVLYDMLKATENLELKKFIIFTLKRYGKKSFSSIIGNKLQGNDFSGDLDRSAVHFLALNWRLGGDKAEARKLDILSKNVFWKTAKAVTAEVTKSVETPKTLHYFSRLFVLRRMREIIGSNQLIPAKQLAETISRELTGELNKFNRAQRETHYSQTETTTGFEIQPVTGKNPLPLLVDNKEINQIVKFARLGSQDDKPFEIRLFPSANPISQLLIFREILSLTGIPIERAGVQINFGGVGKKKENILALQRIILAAGRLKLPPEPFLRYGNYWALLDYTGFSISRKKGEVNIRDKFDLAVKRVLPKKFKAKDFGIVSEVRAPVGADSFYVFAKGFLAAHDLANMIRESEQNPNGNTSWENLCQHLDLALKQTGLPEIKTKWSRDDWKKFARLTQNQDNELKQTLRDFFEGSKPDTV